MATLRDLGLSEYEARAYRSLLETGPTTAKELSRSSDVPMGRIYDVLKSLETHNLVRSQTASRPKKYVAVEPETALDRLLEDKKRELEEKAAQYEEIVDSLSDDLEAAEPLGETFWTAAVGPEETAELLIERLTAAEDRIIIVTSQFSQQFDLDEIGDRSVATLKDALDRGVEVSLLMPPEMVEALPENVGDRYRDLLQPHDGFEVRTSEDVIGTFEMIDDTEVCIEVPHPLREDETFAVIDFKDPEFAATVTAEFEARWADADPLEL
ncbi:TrmB family transcriptional regulator [Halapricum hydrolyticum]|uniref:TrmB family transcriptional regulator n=1 Tax=Halapricum hydrolyticum TaxID=2979991 RepID=A0AAE3ICM4_9EURY|nr:TrmB family transcriptional regulator [Halapricum hydrolyticum]MCU4718652.1 TrmB family transcriptional regulator [Halapricum hydrolyticum]MCU4727662.1 TrmB family transcriptional regulator [Halapricum hydrolyticum]